MKGWALLLSLLFCLEFEKHFVLLNVDLLPNLVFDLGNFGDFTCMNIPRNGPERNSFGND